MGKVLRLVEYQPGVQRNLHEALDFIWDEVDAGNVKSMLIIYNDGVEAGYIPATDKRDYRKSSILWDTVQFIQHLIG